MKLTKEYVDELLSKVINDNFIIETRKSWTDQFFIWDIVDKKADIICMSLFGCWKSKFNNTYDTYFSDIEIQGFNENQSWVKFKWYHTTEELENFFKTNKINTL